MKRVKLLIKGDVLIAVLVVCVAIALYFGSAVQAAAADEYEHLKIGLPRKIAGVDPLGYPRLSRAELDVQMAFFDHLFRRNEKGEIVGHLAEGYKWIDPNTFRVMLRQGVKFHNGDEFTADDVKWSIEDMLNPDRGPGLVGVVKGITEVRVIDKYTADIITEAPIPVLPAKLACYTLMVSGKERSTKSPQEYENKPMGTGPFKFVEWEKGKHVIAVRNEDYFLGMPKIKKVTFYPIDDYNTRLSALKSGNIDIAIDINPSQAKELEKTPGFEVTATPSARTEWVWIRTDVKPFDDKRVRQALNYAINKQEYVQALLEGYGLPSGQPTPPYFFGHNPNVGLYEYNPEKAKQLLAEAGVPKNFTIVYETPAIFEERARGVAGYLEAIGLKVKVESKEFGAAYADLLERKARPLFHLNWGNWSLLDIDGTLLDCFGCTNKDTGAGRWSYYCNPRIDGIIKDIRTIDEAKRLELAHEASKIIHEDAAVIFLFTHYDIHGKREGIPEFKARLDNTFRLKWMKGGGEY